MKLKAVFVIIPILLAPAISMAQFDLEQDVLHIPSSHETKQYEWRAKRNPRGFGFSINSDKGEKGRFILDLKMPTGIEIEEIHIFITDEELEIYRHVEPMEKKSGKYEFNFLPPKASEYRFEVVLKTEKRWIDLRDDLALPGTMEARSPDNTDGKHACGIKIKRDPERIYADHVVTFIYEYCCAGESCKESNRLDDSEMHVAAWRAGWFLKWNEFEYATPKQNLGGSIAAVSLVFKTPGKHVIFTEIKQGGEVKQLRNEVRVYREPEADDY